MKQIKKMLAVLLVLVLMLAMTSCSGSVGKWIARSANTEVPVGAYLMYESVYYQYATYYVSDYTKSPLKQDITTGEGDEKETLTGAEWIKKQTMDIITNAITVYEECNRLGITLTDAEKDIVLDDAATMWEQNSAAYKQVGVGQKSLEYMYEYNELYTKLFDSIYGEKGTTPVKNDELKKYVTENYDSVHYFSVSLKDSNSKALSKEEQNKIEDELEALGEKLNSGEKFEKIVAEYNKAHEKATVTASHKIGVMEDQFASDLYKKLDKCEPGTAVVVEYSDYMYLLYREKIEDAVDEYLEDNADTIRHEMKDEEYTKYLEEAEKKLSIEINDAAVEKYSPKWIENRAG
ncbi:MAG: hypothetical protein IJY28_07180 [Clostridia bacterium]|nr:hypothetical protein [Clostridia bacterium]